MARTLPHPYGTEIYAADSGTVVECTRHWSWGDDVKIDHGNGYQTLYAHMSAQAVHVGDVVEQGQVIGYVGNTGNSFGNHCHFEMYYNDRLFSARDVFPDMPEWNRSKPPSGREVAHPLTHFIFFSRHFTFSVLCARILYIVKATPACGAMTRRWWGSCLFFRGYF